MKNATGETSIRTNGVTPDHTESGVHAQLYAPTNRNLVGIIGRGTAHRRRAEAAIAELPEFGDGYKLEVMRARLDKTVKQRRELLELEPDNEKRVQAYTNNFVELLMQSMDLAAAAGDKTAELPITAFEFDEHIVSLAVEGLMEAARQKGLTVNKTLRDLPHGLEDFRRGYETRSRYQITASGW